MIDPQNQANKWIRNLEMQNELNVVKITESYKEVTAFCVQTGKPLLLEHIYEEWDTFFNSILQRYPTIEG